jgi:hypothetical protein
MISGPQFGCGPFFYPIGCMKWANKILSWEPVKSTVRSARFSKYSMGRYPKPIGERIAGIESEYPARITPSYACEDSGRAPQQAAPSEAQTHRRFEGA